MRRAHRQGTYELFSLLVQLFELLVENPFRLELVIGIVESKCAPGVLDRVVRVRLDVLAKHEPRKKAERQPALPSLEEVQVHGVNDLLRWDKDVCTAEGEKVTGDREILCTRLLMMRKSFESPCPMKTHPRSTRRRSFL